MRYLFYGLAAEKRITRFSFHSGNSWIIWERAEQHYWVRITITYKQNSMETSSLGTVKTLHDTWLAFSSNGARPCRSLPLFLFFHKRIWRIAVRGSIPYLRVEIKKIEITASLQIIVNHSRTSNLLRSRAERNEMMTSANGISFLGSITQAR